MIEDVIMQSEEVPDRNGGNTRELRAVQGEIAAALIEIMVGLDKGNAFDAANHVCRARRHMSPVLQFYL